MPVGELLARTSSRELTEWMAYEQLTGPLGQERDDYLAASIAATVANSLRKRRRAYPMEQFLIGWFGRARHKAEQSVDEMLAAVRVINKALGGSDKRDDHREPAYPPRRRRS